MVFGSDMLEKLVSENAPIPIEFTVLGTISLPVRPKQPQKAA